MILKPFLILIFVSFIFSSSYAMDEEAKLLSDYTLLSPHRSIPSNKKTETLQQAFLQLSKWEMIEETHRHLLQHQETMYPQWREGKLEASKYLDLDEEDEDEGEKETMEIIRNNGTFFSIKQEFEQLPIISLTVSKKNLGLYLDPGWETKKLVAAETPDYFILQVIPMVGPSYQEEEAFQVRHMLTPSLMKTFDDCISSNPMVFCPAWNSLNMDKTRCFRYLSHLNLFVKETVTRAAQRAIGNKLLNAGLEVFNIQSYIKNNSSSANDILLCSAELPIELVDMIMRNFYIINYYDKNFEKKQ